MFPAMSLLFALVFLFAACSAPVPRDAPAGHLHASTRQAARNEVPDIVDTYSASAQPAAASSAPPARYSVMVEQVAARDILIALARDAGLELDVSPDIEGKVTLNVVHQPVEVILERIARQIPIRFELAGNSLLVRPDHPYLAHYNVDYVNLERKVSSEIANHMQIGAIAGNAASAGSVSSTRIENASQHLFWQRLKISLEQLLTAGEASETGKAAPPPVINAEAGMVSVFATRRQHREVRALIDRLTQAIRRQVLVEATIVEVALNESHEQGIDWTSLVHGGILEISGNTLKTSANITYRRDGDPQALVTLLDRFGDSRVLSSPRLSVLNNQTALLKVVENYVYFTVRADTTTTANVGTSTTYTTTPQTVSVGLVMGVTPQIADDDTVILNIRPSITSIGAEVPDPNPDLRRNGIENLVPVIRTREIESVMRVANGQIAVLGGLMEDGIDHHTNRVPGLGQIPLAGELFNNRDGRSRKTELVIFLRPTIIREASLDGDYAPYAARLPDRDFFTPGVAGGGKP